MTDWTTEKILAEVHRQANLVTSDATTRRRHPSYITKASGREHLHRLKGAAELARVVLGDLPDDTVRRLMEAFDAAAGWL
ncbi:hypothetical protein [Mycobacterium phage PP]|uniref:Uncharacterized protein n=1 Tax=Mycobacterium phage PP TaxID=2077134 RepID=A0A2Z5XVB2_9CAUD|nr:hypothetical protein KIW36_gp02 [Mycobacterium phage PP]BBC53796.1 hypothetical protein [Mycobacterium phage PP]